MAPANLRGFIAAKQTRPNPGNGGNIIDVVEIRRLEGIHAVGHLEGKGGGSRVTKKAKSDMKRKELVSSNCNGRKTQHPTHA